MKRSPLTLGVAAALCAATSLAFLQPTHAQAASSDSFDVAKALKIPELSSFAKVDLSQVTIANKKTDSHPLQASSVTPRTVATSTLTNDTNETRNMTSQAETVATTDTVTATSTREINTSTTVKAEAEFDLLVSIKASLEFSVGGRWEWGDSQTKTTTVTRTLPSQTAAVPAHSSILVSAVLSEAKYAGSYSTSGDLVGDVTLTKPCGTSVTVPIGQLLSLRRDDGSLIAPDYVSANPDGTSSHVVNPVDVSGTVGTDMVVQFTDGATGKLISQKTIESGRSATPTQPTQPKAVTPATASSFTGTRFSQLAGSVHCNLARVAAGTGDSVNPTLQQYPGVASSAVPVGGPYTLGDRKLFYEGQVVAEDVSSAAGYLNGGSAAGDWRVNYVQGGVAKQANKATPSSSTYLVVPATAVALGYNYFYDAPSKVLYYKNTYISGGVTSAKPWLSNQNGNTYYASYIANGVAKLTDSVNPSFETYRIPALTASSQALAGRLFLTAPGGSLYLGSTLIPYTEGTTSATAFINGSDSQYGFSYVQNGVATSGSIVAGIVAVPSNAIYPAAQGGSLVALGYHYFFDPASRRLWYKNSLVASNVVAAVGWLSRFDGNTYLATYLADVTQ